MLNCITQWFLILFFFINTEHAVVTRWRILDDGRRSWHRWSMAHIQSGAVVCFSSMQQCHPFIGLDTRSKVSTIRTFHTATVSIYQLLLPFSMLSFQISVGGSCYRIDHCIPHWFQPMASRVSTALLGNRWHSQMAERETSTLNIANKSEI